MKRKNKNLSKKISAITALLLAFVFMIITAVQAFHRHSTVSVKDTQDEQEYVYSSEKCSVCEYVVHKQSNHAHLAYPPVVIMPITKAVTLQSATIAGIYKLTLQGYTNKGPPSASC